MSQLLWISSTALCIFSAAWLARHQHRTGAPLLICIGWLCGCAAIGLLPNQLTFPVWLPQNIVMLALATGPLLFLAQRSPRLTTWGLAVSACLFAALAYNWWQRPLWQATAYLAGCLVAVLASTIMARSMQQAPRATTALSAALAITYAVLCISAASVTSLQAVLIAAFCFGMPQLWWAYSRPNQAPQHLAQLSFLIPALVALSTVFRWVASPQAPNWQMWAPYAVLALVLLLPFLWLLLSKCRWWIQWSLCLALLAAAALYAQIAYHYDPTPPRSAPAWNYG